MNSIHDDFTRAMRDLRTARAAERSCKVTLQKRLRLPSGAVIKTVRYVTDATMDSPRNFPYRAVSCVYVSSADPAAKQVILTKRFLEQYGAEVTA